MKKSWLALALLFLLQMLQASLWSAKAYAEFAYGYFNNWENDCQLKQTGNYYSGTAQAHMGGDNGLKFDLDDNESWGAGTAAVVNETIGSAHMDSTDNLAMEVADGYYYTFHLAGEHGWENRSYVVMKTQHQPAVILKVNDNHESAYDKDVTVTAYCAAGTATSISPEEAFYIQYTTDDWKTKHLVAMDSSGLTPRGKIPGQVGGTTIRYIVFSSTMPSNLFTDDVILSSPDNIDQLSFCMMAAANNGTPFTYTTEWEHQPVFGPATFILSTACTAIEKSAFEGDTSIEIVDASHCCSIGNGAFKGCSGLTQIKLPKDCAISESAFADCGTIFVFAPAGGRTETDCGKALNLVFVEE